MSRAILLCVPVPALLLLIVALPWSSAADGPAATDPGSNDDVADLVIMMPNRPVLVRLHLSIDSLPYTTFWEARMRRVFDFFDRDSDGILDKEEARLLPSIYRLQQLFSGDLTFGIRGGNNNNNQPPLVDVNIPPPFDELDVNSDGKVTFEEFLRYYRHTEAGPILMFAQDTVGQGVNKLTDILFTALNTNKDGKLSRAEMMAAEKMLRQFDTNDDELVSAQELRAQGAGGNQAAQGALFPGTLHAGKLFHNIPVVLVPREDAARQPNYRMPMIKDLISVYDKDKRQKLSAEQVAFPKELFEKLDPTRSGSIGPREMFRWVVFHPDVEMALRLGRSPGGDRVQAAAGDDGKAQGLLAAKKIGENALAVALEGAHVTALRSETQYAQNDGVKAQYLEQFKALDRQRNGYLKLDQLQKLDKDPNAVTIMALFALADHDGNERLTEKEFTDFLDWAISLAESQARLTFADNGQSLFEMLDANHDGQLSIRELRTAWSRLEEYDRAKQGFITKDQIPRQYQILVSQGQPFMGQNNQAGANFGVTVTQTLPARGPLWFRKMDVNNDGDVSEREFLGSREDFKKIDTDGDGLISVEEAEKAEARFREKMKK